MGVLLLVEMDPWIVEVRPQDKVGRIIGSGGVTVQAIETCFAVVITTAHGTDEKGGFARVVICGDSAAFILKAVRLIEVRHPVSADR